ncbi:MAG: hypothetical protein GYB53_20280 [Rhodobacteraceae bacterium]|nr:hypothetical protein [Paracoccaceae bacterium]
MATLIGTACITLCGAGGGASAQTVCATEIFGYYLDRSLETADRTILCLIAAVQPDEEPDEEPDEDEETTQTSLYGGSGVAIAEVEDFTPSFEIGPGGALNPESMTNDYFGQIRMSLGDPQDGASSDVPIDVNLLLQHEGTLSSQSYRMPQYRKLLEEAGVASGLDQTLGEDVYLLPDTLYPMGGGRQGMMADYGGRQITILPMARVLEGTTLSPAEREAVTRRFEAISGVGAAGQ